MDEPKYPNATQAQAPRLFPLKQVRADLKRFGIRLVEAGCQGGLLVSGDSGGLSGLIQAIFGAAENFWIEEQPVKVEELAWKLVRNALLRAMATLYDEGVNTRDPAQGGLEHLKAQVEIALDDEAHEVPNTLFKNPGTIPLVLASRKPFARWLRLIGLNDAEAKSLANRLPDYAAVAFHQEWRSQREYYRPLENHYESPFAPAAQMAWDWERNRCALIKQIEEPVFEETFSLREVYVPLSAYRREETRDDEHSDGWQTRKSQLHIVDLHEAIEQWINGSERSDAIRLIAGGPGSGKSSFAKKLAADLAKDSRMRVLYLPLQRLLTDIDLRSAIERYLQESGAFAESPLAQSGFASQTNPLLLVFDGLDELTKPGDFADEMTRKFVQELRTQIGIWNSAERRVLALITGRTVVAQAHRPALGLDETRMLGVLPYLIEEDDSAELAQREEADIVDPGNRLAIDQRQEWWGHYAAAKGLPAVTEFPSILNINKDIKELTKEPLLNYLVFLSRFHQEANAPKNRNAIYQRLFQDVIDRRHARRDREDHPVHDIVRDVANSESFERLLEVIATAAWYGDGRTTTLEEARALCPHDIKGKLDELTKDKRGFVRLLAACYSRETRQQRESEQAFEFTHKSFGEYLTARRLVREFTRLDKGLRESPESVEEKRADWCRLTGAQAMTLDLLRFLRDEVALRKGKDVELWQETLTRLFNRNLANGPPLDALGQGSYRAIERKACQAEEALLAALNACVRTTKTNAVIEWPQANSAGEMLHRLRGQREPSDPSVTLSCLEWLALANQLLSVQDLVGAKLRGADLRRAALGRADLRGADLGWADLGRANLDGADLGRANLDGADLRRADLRRADLRGANLDGADLRRADLRRADLRGASLRGVDFSGADLSATDNITQAQLEQARRDESTKLPEGLTIPME